MNRIRNGNLRKKAPAGRLVAKCPKDYLFIIVFAATLIKSYKNGMLNSSCLTAYKKKQKTISNNIIDYFMIVKEQKIRLAFIMQYFRVIFRSKRQEFYLIFYFRTSLRVIQYQNFTSNLRRTFANDRLWERFSDCSVLTVPPATLRNASLVDIPTYLVTGDNTTPLLPELLNIDNRLPSIPSETSCLAAVTKSYSPLREAVDVCGESYVLNNN